MIILGASLATVLAVAVTARAAFRRGKRIGARS